MHIYEYLFAAVIIVSILLASSTMVGTLSEPYRNVSGKEQLKDTAQKILTQILLDPGYPPDWGSNITIGEDGLKTFGLARYGETTREAYVLDADKVLRLNKTDSSFTISPHCVLNLLNLGQDYGFALEFSPPLIVNVSGNPDTDKYEISVRSEYGELPIASANVAAKLYYIDSNEIASAPTQYNFTRYDGKCTVNFGIISTQMKVLITVIDYYGIQLVKTYVHPQSLEPAKVTLAYILGNYIFPLDLSIKPDNEAHEIIVARNVTSNQNMIENVTFSLNENGPGEYEVAYVDPYTAAILSKSQDGASLILASKDVTSTYSSISGSWSFPFAHSLERTVTVGGSTYNVRLHLWRMSW